MGARRVARRRTFATETFDLKLAPRATEAGGFDTERTTRSALGARFCVIAAAVPTRSASDATPKPMTRQRLRLARPQLPIPAPASAARTARQSLA
jgi:hypothetical protein